MITISRRLISVFVVSIFGSLLLCLFGLNPLFAMSIGVIATILITYSKTIYKDFAIIFFSIAFFFFLMSNEAIIEFLGLEGGLRESTTDADRHYLVVLVISLISLLVGYQICFVKKHVKLSEINTNELPIRVQYRKVSKTLFYLTFVFYLIPVVERAIYVSNYSYYLSYVSYQSNIPFLITKIGEMCPIFFAIYLATFPGKKECRGPVVLYLIYGFCYFLTGKRYETVATVLFIIIYFVIRNETDKKYCIKWISKRSIGVLVLCIPVILGVLAAYSTIRTGNSLVEGTTYADLLLALFTGVADSDKVIKYGYIYKDQFPEGHFYTFGNIIDYFKYGAISRAITGENITVSQTVEYALNGNGYSYTLSYLYYPTKFLAGHGLGSCYIAQLYQDMGYVGVSIGNIVLGIIIRNVFTLSQNSILKNAVIFYMFKLLMLMPRFDYDVILRELCGVSFLATVIIFIFITKVLYSDKKLNKGRSTERELKS